jgi:ABC-type multidrug transport system ATPase subunit/pSer/pThr/pTyr-binding forkhead associated (FHA) protein
MTCPVCGEPITGAFCGSCGKPTAGHSPTIMEGVNAPVPGKQRTILGSAPDCDVVLNEPTISAHHLAISPGSAPGMLLLEDLGSTNGTYVAGERITKKEVSAREPVQLGTRPVDLSRFVGAMTMGGATMHENVLMVGRLEPADLVIPYPMISARHLEIRAVGPSIQVRDLGSANGTWIDGIRIQGWVTLKEGQALQLGSFRVPPGTVQDWMLRLGTPEQEGHQVTIPPTGTLTIGRDPESDICIELPQVSWNHARIESEDGNWTLVDLGSSNGTWVNGSRIKRTRITGEDAVTLGSVPLDLGQGRVQSQQRYQGEVRLDAVGITRQLTKGPAAGKIILDDVAVSIYPGELVALMGPSGAGKTTLLEMLTGQRRPSKGRVLFNGDVLHDHPALLDRIGYVPQEDIMHRDLTVFQVLHYAAKIRLPSDLPDRAVIEHVNRLITRMGLAHIRDSLIGGEAVRGISGGQRKRVNIALELITEPPLLFLDEPTSGLDSTSTLEVLDVLRQLADTGKTIIMTIHQPRVEAFEQVDKLLLLTKGGKLAYFGPAIPGTAEYFSARSQMPYRQGGNPADFAIDVLDPSDDRFARSPDEWKADYLASEEFKTWVVARQQSSDQVILTSSKAQAAAARGGLSQYLTLLERYTKRKLRDRTSLAIQFMQPVIIGVLLVALFGAIAGNSDDGLPTDRDTLEEWFCATHPGEDIPGSDDDEVCHESKDIEDFNEKYVDHPGMDEIPQPEKPDEMEPHPAFAKGVNATLFLLAAAAFWLGCSNVARELVSERSVYRRERRSGLNIRSYLASVFTFQMLLSMVQTIVMTVLVWAAVDVQGETILSSWIVLLITAGSGVALGLAVSAGANTEVTAISVIPILLLPQLMLAGYLKVYDQMGELLQALTIFVPLRWSFNSLAKMEYLAWERHLRRDEQKLAFSLEDVFGFGDLSPGFCALVLILMSVTFLGIAQSLLVRTSSHSGH